MAGLNSSITFIKVMDKNKSLTRYLDVVPYSRKGTLNNPHHFSYRFLGSNELKESTYSMASEYLNYPEVMNNLRDYFPDKTRSFLLGFSNSMMTQLRDTPSDNDLNEVASLILTFSEDTPSYVLNYHLLPGEKFVEIYYNPNIDDPYGLVNSEDLELVIGPLEFFKEDYLRVISTGFTVDTSNWKISEVANKSSKVEISNLIYSDLGREERNNNNYFLDSLVPETFSEGKGEGFLNQEDLFRQGRTLKNKRFLSKEDSLVFSSLPPVISYGDYDPTKYYSKGDVVSFRGVLYRNIDEDYSPGDKVPLLSFNWELFKK